MASTFWNQYDTCVTCGVAPGEVCVDMRSAGVAKDGRGVAQPLRNPHPWRDKLAVPIGWFPDDAEVDDDGVLLRVGVHVTGRHVDELDGTVEVVRTDGVIVVALDIGGWAEGVAAHWVADGVA